MTSKHRQQDTPSDYAHLHITLTAQRRSAWGGATELRFTCQIHPRLPRHLHNHAVPESPSSPSAWHIVAARSTYKVL